MTELVRRPELCFKDAEEAMFGRSSPIPTHRDAAASSSSESPFEDDGINVNEDSNDNEDFNAILEAVYEKSGYVVMDNVVQAPKDDSWFADLVSDLRALYDTNNCVRIFNNRDDSHSHKKDDGKRHMLLFSKFKVQEKFPGMTRAATSNLIRR